MAAAAQQQTVFSPEIDEQAFRAACSRFATGITIATLRGMDGKPHGVTVNSFTSVSCVPPLILFCLKTKSSVIDHFNKANTFAINILDVSQQAVCDRFARRIEDRFEGIAWEWGPAGAPRLLGVLACMECRKQQTVECGDHAIFIGEVIRADYRDGTPLVFFAREYGAIQRLE